MAPRSCYSAFGWYRGEYGGITFMKKYKSNRSRVNKDSTKAMIELAINRGLQWPQFGLDTYTYSTLVSCPSTHHSSRRPGCQMAPRSPWSCGLMALQNISRSGGRRLGEYLQSGLLHERTILALLNGKRGNVQIVRSNE